MYCHVYFYGSGQAFYQLSYIPSSNHNVKNQGVQELIPRRSLLFQVRGWNYLYGVTRPKLTVNVYRRMEGSFMDSIRMSLNS